MQVPAGGDEGDVLIGGDVVLGADLPTLGAAGVVGERVAAVLAPAALRVPHRVVALAGVQPQRLDLFDARGRGGGRGDEVDVPREVHAGRGAHEVVEHVVEDPRILGAVAVAEAPRELRDRLLVACGGGRG